jgi:hypothetical protein
MVYNNDDNPEVGVHAELPVMSQGGAPTVNIPVRGRFPQQLPVVEQLRGLLQIFVPRARCTFPIISLFSFLHSAPLHGRPSQCRCLFL